MAKTRIEVRVRASGDEARDANIGHLAMLIVRKLCPKASVVLCQGSGAENEVINLGVYVNGEYDEGASEALELSGAIGDLTCHAHRWESDFSGRRMTRIELRQALQEAVCV